MRRPTTFLRADDAATGVVTLTLNRPDRMNALTFEVYDELRHTFRDLSDETGVRAVILTGAGDAFCTGGDVKQRAETGDYGPTRSGMFEIGYLHKLIRDIPKPVIAAVNGPIPYTSVRFLFDASMAATSWSAAS